VPSQVVYQTNAEWYASYEALANNSLVKADTTEKGIIQFWFKDNPTLFMLSPTGKLQVKWSNFEEKKVLFKLVKHLLVAGDNGKVVIKPLRQQVWIEYPVPKPFKLYWCSEATEYVLKEPVLGLPKRQSEIEAENRIEASRAELAEVKKAVDELRHEFRFLREPTFNEVALKTDIMNAQQLRTDLLLVGWKDESPEYAKLNAEHALNLAAWLSYKEKSDQNLSMTAMCKKAIDTANLSILKQAKIVLKHYADIVPRVEETQLRWPEQTKAKWIQIFAEKPPAPQAWNSQRLEEEKRLNSYRKDCPSSSQMSK
jgi:hypothetical protein